MNNRNIVLFSSGASEQNGILGEISGALTGWGYCCAEWKSLFANANDSDMIALLPMLIKKIPTFDYAVLICQGHDVTTITRGAETIQVKTMRDNVLFEIGLCVMALGVSRTILVTDEDVRLPDDLAGIHGTLAVQRFFLSDAQTTAKEIDSYIRKTGDALHQVIIGASCSTASGYVSNFVCRLLEHIHEGIQLIEYVQEKTSERTSQKRKRIIDSMSFDPQKIHLHILLPKTAGSFTKAQLDRLQKGLLTGEVPTARFRPIEFACRLEGDALHIVDCPTNIVTTYDTARLLLELQADDAADQQAEARFVSKELKLYEATLRTLLTRTHIAQIMEQFYTSLPKEQKDFMIDQIMDIVDNRLTIEKVNL